MTGARTARYGGVSRLSHLRDVDVETEVPITNDLFAFDGTKWISVDAVALLTGTFGIINVDQLQLDGGIVSTTTGDIAIQSPSGSDVILFAQGAGVVVIDNLHVGGNTIISANTNGNINLIPNGTGSVAISKVDINGGDISGVTISGGLTWNAAQNLNSQPLTNVNIDSGAIDGVTIGTNLPCTDLRVDNLKLDGNDISTISGNLTFTPNGNSHVDVTDGHRLRILAGTSTVTPTSGKGIDIWFAGGGDRGQIQCRDRTGGVNAYKDLRYSAQTHAFYTGTSWPVLKATLSTAGVFDVVGGFSDNGSAGIDATITSGFKSFTVRGGLITSWTT